MREVRTVNFVRGEKTDKYQVRMEPVEVPAPAGSVIYVVYVIHLQAVTWSFVLTRITYVLVLKGFTVYLTFLKYIFQKLCSTKFNIEVIVMRVSI